MSDLKENAFINPDTDGFEVETEGEQSPVETENDSQVKMVTEEADAKANKAMAEAEESEEEEAHPEPEEEEEEPEKPKSRKERKEERKQRKLSTRITELSSAERAALDKLREAEARAEEAERKLAERDKAPEPQPEDFDDLDDYDKALNDWKAAQTAPDDDPVADRAIIDIRTLAEAFSDELPDDYSSKVEGQYPLNRQTLIAVSEMDSAPHVLYHIASNPEVAQKLAKIKTDVRLVSALDAIEADLMTGEIEHPAKNESKNTYKPIEEPLSGGDSPKEFDPEKASEREYIDHMNKSEGSGRFW